MDNQIEMSQRPMVHLFQGEAWGDFKGKIVEFLTPDEVTPLGVSTLLSIAGEDAGIQYHYSNKNQLSLHVQNGDYLSIGVVKHLTLDFGEYNEAYLDNDEAWMVSGSQYFWTGFRVAAIEAFVGRLKSEQAGTYYQSNHSESLEVIKVRNTKRLRFSSHFAYLDAILEQFWRLTFRVNPSDMACAGIVGAHGDKCYSYKDEWKAAGIPFEHGSLLYLLTYTDARGSYPKSKSLQWVIDNYAKYLPRILAAEMAVLCFKYQLDANMEVDWDNITVSPREDGLSVWSCREYGVLVGEYTAKTKTDAVKMYLHKFPKKFVQDQA